MHRLIAILALAIPITAFADSADDARKARWEKDIAALEKRQKSAEKGGIVFAGSSTIVKWDTAKAFPELKPINSGFGGSEIRDSTMFADRVILNHEPRAIVFYAGDNDIGASRTPEQVLADFQAFAETIHKKLPKTRIHFISIKPSILRWKQFETQSKANKLVKEFCAKDERLNYIDVVPALLGSDGRPKPELLAIDGLHLSAKGYEILNDAVRKALK
jgi:lysophospholipase L1-like esterase